MFTGQQPVGEHSTPSVSFPHADTQKGSCTEHREVLTWLLTQRECVRTALPMGGQLLNGEWMSRRIGILL